MNLAPIVLFVYNRPWHTRKTLEALSRNELADQSILYIYADGAKDDSSQSDLRKIGEVEKTVRSRRWCKDHVFVKREKNWGLADNIIDGVTSVINEYGKVIVLEDDIVTSPGFIKYMNDALLFYETEKKVMHISGYTVPIQQKIPSTFFYNVASSWGWGTWKRSWSKMNSNSSELLVQIQEKGQINKFNIEGSFPFYTQLFQNAEGTLKTWAVLWYANIFLNRGFCLHPFPSLVQNIGIDGSGENCGKTNRFQWTQLANFINVESIPISEDKMARRAIHNFLIDKNYNLFFQTKKQMWKFFLILKHKFEQFW